MDPITWVYHCFLDIAGGLSPASFGLFVRLYLMFGLAFLLAGFAFRQGNRSSLVQVLAIALGMLIGVAWPLEMFLGLSPVVRAWFLLVGGIVVVALPAYLPFLVTRYHRLQTDLRCLFYLLLIMLIGIHICLRVLVVVLHQLGA